MRRPQRAGRHGRSMCSPLFVRAVPAGNQVLGRDAVPHALSTISNAKAIMDLSPQSSQSPSV